MLNIKEIKSRINSVRDTEKITGAMQLIATAKLQKAKRELSKTRPYFHAIQGEIKRIFRVNGKINSRYFYPPTGEHELPGAYAYLVVTADKGLAGAYNLKVIKTAEEKLRSHGENELFVVGEYGRHYFHSHNIPVSESFLYTAQNPTFQRAREICDLMLEGYNSGKYAKIFVIYTDFVNGMRSDVRCERLLPFHRGDFMDHAPEKEITEPFEFSPSMEEVLENIVPSYVAGYIYSALIDSFCSEQNARMTAMKAACDNAEKLLSELTAQYNHVRQSEITRELTEISAGSAARKDE
ncbi:MAG: ATP synthase F1 subunit gamma [Clostridia bacterium]|nr:ATP synthase F1 subunit gamma [Clostridia bacterium]